MFIPYNAKKFHLLRVDKLFLEKYFPSQEFYLPKCFIFAFGNNKYSP